LCVSILFSSLLTIKYSTASLIRGERKKERRRTGRGDRSWVPVAHVYNPSYSEGKISGVSLFEASLGK
jgi:hypothetical protein